jgi:hypothetical protein
MEEILPINFYSELVGIMVDCTILNSLLSKYIPELSEHLITNGFELNLNNFIYKWFVSLFIQNFNDEFSLIIWDFLFLEGSIVLFKAALAIFMNLKNSILNHYDFEKIYSIFSNATFNLQDKYLLLYYLGLRQFEFNYEFINVNRVNFLNPITQTIKREGNTLNENVLKRHCIKECSKEWPFCLSSNNSRIINCLVLNTGSKSKIIEDYFFEGVGKNKNSLPLEFTDVLCERQLHYCENKNEFDLLLRSTIV